MQREQSPPALAERGPMAANYAEALAHGLEPAAWGGEEELEGEDIPPDGAVLVAGGMGVPYT